MPLLHKFHFPLFLFQSSKIQDELLALPLTFKASEHIWFLKSTKDFRIKKKNCLNSESKNTFLKGKWWEIIFNVIIIAFYPHELETIDNFKELQRCCEVNRWWHLSIPKIGTAYFIKYDHKLALFFCTHLHTSMTSVCLCFQWYRLIIY